MIATSWIEGLIDQDVDDDLSAEIDLKFPCDTVIIRIPTLTNSSISLMVSDKSGGSFYDLHTTDLADGSNTKVITAKATTAHIVQMPLGGFQFIKLKASDAQAADRTFAVRGVRG